MKEIEIQDKTLIYTINTLVFIIGFLLLFPLVYSIALLAEKNHFMVNQTYLIIFCLSIITIGFCLILKFTMNELELIFYKEHLVISDKKKKKSNKVYYTNIDNYNIYYLLIKKMGIMFRLKTNRNNYYWMVNNSALDNSFTESLIKVKKGLEKCEKKYTYSDFITLFLASTPWLMIITSFIIVFLVILHATGIYNVEFINAISKYL
ncbi:hypothetical protein ETU10_01130 [Apibacter muscae]|uniref:hypothetical protein n=1 Tax=Apibacter muscae TaxID=2509004 RepID=UPI0011AC3FB4|nr:hypothetical protein [Apibacter muscae]TWP25266.1 hypothetical protein ETU10_01130 [Apibacter muscae]